jgi:ComF family protein
VGKLLDGLKNILFPSLCFGCREYTPEHLPLCNRCRSKLSPVGFWKTRRRAVSLFSAFAYTPQIKELLHHFKYTPHYRYLYTYIVRLTQSALDSAGANIKDYDILSCVPMHHSKIREREFNHAVLVGDGLAQEAGIRFRPDLLSVKTPYPLQAHLSAKERLNNAAGRFILNHGYPDRCGPGKKFILYDDVFTTGSTVFSCLRELLKLQPAKILILTFAKASSHR